MTDRGLITDRIIQEQLSNQTFVNELSTNTSSNKKLTVDLLKALRDRIKAFFMKYGDSDFILLAKLIHEVHPDERHLMIASQIKTQERLNDFYDYVQGAIQLMLQTSHKGSSKEYTPAHIAPYVFANAKVVLSLLKDFKDKTAGLDVKYSGSSTVEEHIRSFEGPMEDEKQSDGSFENDENDFDNVMTGMPE